MMLEQTSDTEKVNESEENVNLNEQEPTVTIQKKPKLTDNERARKIKSVVQDSTKFNEDSSENISIKPNIPLTVMFFENWYDRHSDLLEYAVRVKKLSSPDAMKYADENYRIKHEMATSSDDGREYGRTIYRVTVPESGFPEMVKNLTLSSKKAVEQINKELEKISLEHEGKILMNITKKVGATKFDVEWAIEAHPVT